MIKSLICILAFTAAAGCESTTIITGKIDVDPSVAPATPASLLVIVGNPDDVGVFDPVGQRGDNEDINFAPGTLSYSYRWETFGTSGPDTYVGAFIDLDNDGHLGAGEPFGMFAQNPIIDPKGGMFADPNYADVTIDSVAQ